jgi:hypothetical protein
MATITKPREPTKHVPLGMLQGEVLNPMLAMSRQAKRNTARVLAVMLSSSNVRPQLKVFNILASFNAASPPIYSSPKSALVLSNTAGWIIAAMAELVYELWRLQLVNHCSGATARVPIPAGVSCPIGASELDTEAAMVI